MDENNVSFSSADMKDLYNEVFAGSDVVKEESKVISSELDTATKETNEEEVETKDEEKESDLPWDTDDEDDDKKEDPVDEDDDEELKKLELSEKWRQKRLNKELDKRKAAEEENTRLKSELESLRTPTKEETKTLTPKPIYENPKTVDEVVGNMIFQDPVIIELAKREQYIKSHKDEFADMGDYADALSSIQTDLKTEIKFKDREIREYLSKEQNNTHTEEQKIAETYDKKIESVKELYPQVTKAKEELTKIADKLHVEIRRALVMDENSGELTWALGSSKKNMTYLLEASKIAETNGRLPIDAIKFIGRLSSEITNNKVPDDTDVRIAKQEKTLPKTIKQRPGRANDENDPVQWAKSVREGKIKIPEWLR